MTVYFFFISIHFFLRLSSKMYLIKLHPVCDLKCNPKSGTDLERTRHSQFNSKWNTPLRATWAGGARCVPAKSHGCSGAKRNFNTVCLHAQPLTREAGRRIERSYLDWQAHMLHAVVLLFKQQGTRAASRFSITGHFWQVTPGGTASFRHLCQFMAGTHNDSLIGRPHLLLFLLGGIQSPKGCG